MHLGGAPCGKVLLVCGRAVRFLPETEAVPQEGVDQLRGHGSAGAVGSLGGELDDDDWVGPEEDARVPDGQSGAEEGRDRPLPEDLLLPFRRRSDSRRRMRSITRMIPNR